MKRGAPLKRNKPIARGKAVRRQRARRVARKTPAEAAYTAWVHDRPCVIAGFECAGPIQQSHARNLNGPTGMGRKESDLHSVPMCRKHHLDEWEAGRGWFAGWTNDQRREWMRARIAEENAAFAVACGVESV